MSRETLVLILPIVWALVSTGIALLLYKSSNAVLKGLNIPGLPTKGVSLAGSVVILVVTFLLLRSATPGDIVVVPRADFQAMRESARQLENASVLLLQCARRDETLDACGQGARSIRTQSADLKRRMDSIQPPSQADTPIP